MGRKPFINTTGLKVYSVTQIKTERKKYTLEEIETFWNSPYELPENEKLMLDLLYKRRIPKNKEEESLLSEMMEIVKSGMILELKGEVF